MPVSSGDSSAADLRGRRTTADGAGAPAVYPRSAAPAATRFRLGRFLLLFACGTLAALGATLLLPHDKFLRYEALNDHSAPHAYWIYERIHTDPTPIDVAFIGSSRTGRSIDSARLEADLAQHGIHVKVANLFQYKTGRNMHYAIAKELLESRPVKLLVLEVTEQEVRSPHPDFIFLADPTDVVLAPLFVNLRYFSDLARLPGRQVDLFLQTVLERLGLRKPEFVPPPYEGPNLDITRQVVTLDGVAHSFDREHPLNYMEDLRRAQDAAVTPALLPARLAWLEYRFPRYYVDQILALAARHGTRVVFLYVPRYGGPDAPAAYFAVSPAALGDPAHAPGPPPSLINVAPETHDYRLWDEETHMNWAGARRFTDAVAERLRTDGYLVDHP